MNISNELKGLFKEYIINKSKPKTYTPRSYHEPFLFGNSIKIYFYEFSNVYSSPRAFYSLESFTKFLATSCKIYLAYYQQEIIRNLGEVYVSCYKGKSELCIRSSYKNLFEAMDEHSRKNSDTPKCTGQILTPIVRHEKGYDGHWYG